MTSFSQVTRRSIGSRRTTWRSGRIAASTIPGKPGAAADVDDRGILWHVRRDGGGVEDVPIPDSGDFSGADEPTSDALLGKHRGERGQLRVGRSERGSRLGLDFLGFAHVTIIAGW